MFFACLPRADPILHALVGDAPATIKRGEGSRDAGDLPLVRVEVRGDCLGGEERTGAPCALGEFLKPALVERSTRTENVSVFICVQYITTHDFCKNGASVLEVAAISCSVLPAPGCGGKRHAAFSRDCGIVPVVLLILVTTGRI